MLAPPTQNPQRMLLRKIADYEHNMNGSECICKPKVVIMGSSEEDDNNVIVHNPFCFIPADFYDAKENNDQ